MNKEEGVISLHHIDSAICGILKQQHMYHKINVTARKRIQ